MRIDSLVPNHSSIFSPKAAAAPLLVCFSHLRWDFVFQRPQHLLTRATKYFRVLFVEEPILKAGVVPHLDTAARPEGVVVCTPVLPEGLSEEEAIEAQRLLVEEMLAGETGTPRVFWYYTPMAMAFSRDIESDLVIYDNMDELSAFLGAPPRLLALERELFSRADIVFTGGVSLYEAKRSRHHNVHAFPSSIDAAHFARARAGVADPADQAGIPHPRLGFFGVIDERMDVALVGRMAALRPDWQFVMLGPVVKIDQAKLPKLPNIHWLGGKKYAELPEYLAGWDLGVMPFAINEATRYISPTKTPEFLAAGVPVVSTPITDVVRPYGDKGLVEIAGTAEEMVAAADRLLRRTKGPWLERVDRFLASTSWDKTFEGMRALVQQALNSDDAIGIAPPAQSRIMSKGSARV
jgi:glycosyltransferase involved in cell wall biosynthesis